MIKKNLKLILGFTLGLILSTGVVKAAGFLASTFDYDNANSNIAASNVQGAIDILKTKADNTLDKTCEVVYGDKNTIGSKFICDLGDKVDRVFYVLKVNTNDVELIMDRNINDGTVDQPTAVAYFTTGAGVAIKNSWTRANDVKIPDAQEIANAVGNTSWNVNTATSSNWFYFDSNNGTYGQTQVANANKVSAYSWLFEYTLGCNTFGCIKNNNLHTNADGYWTSSLVSNDTAYAWFVYRAGHLGFNAASSAGNRGVRPVVVLSKTVL